MIDPDDLGAMNGDGPGDGEPAPYSAGEKVAAVLEAAHNLVMTHQPADRSGWLQLFALRKLVGMAGGVDGLLGLLPPLEDAERWDALLQLGVGIMLELRADDAESVDADQVRHYGAQWLDALMSDAGVPPA